MTDNEEAIRRIWALHAMKEHPDQGPCDAIRYDQYCGDMMPAILAERDALRAEVERLERENVALAAWQCIFHDGSGLTGDEYGNSVCLKHNLLCDMGVAR